MNKMLTIMERQPLNYHAFFKEPWIPGIKFLGELWNLQVMKDMKTSL
jgi:hypothetical protein